MKYFSTLIVIFYISASYAQNTKSKAGPIVKDFGKVYKVKNPDLTLEKNKEYKVIFDIYSDTDKPQSVNPLINTVARFLNMHAQNGISAKSMKVAFVLHGKAVKNALTNKVYQEKYETDNVNIALIKALKKAGVDIYVCGQSVLARGFRQKDISKDVKIALSAMTALVDFQEKGYKVINFN